MGYIGINQSSSMEDTLKVVEKYLLRGCPVMCKRVLFPSAEFEPIEKREHEPVEYEVYVDFDRCEEEV